jgi:hypothetical protein
MPTGNTYPTVGANTTPSSGQIKFSDLNKALQISAGTSLALSWVKGKQKAPTDNIAGAYGEDYFQRNIDGNCDNGNCTNLPDATGGGVYNCTNCKITGTVNCTNCDTQAYLQTNCNCACSYNCTQGTILQNCNCNCLCHCLW